MTRSTGCFEWTQMEQRGCANKDAGPSLLPPTSARLMFVCHQELHHSWSTTAAWHGVDYRWSEGKLSFCAFCFLLYSILFVYWHRVQHDLKGYLSSLLMATTKSYGNALTLQIYTMSALNLWPWLNLHSLDIICAHGTQKNEKPAYLVL